MILVVVSHAVVYVPWRSEGLGKVNADGAVTILCHVAFVISHARDISEVVFTIIKSTGTVR